MLGVRGISRNLWLGFGTVTALLLVSAIAMLLSLRTVQRNVNRLTRVAGRRYMAAHALESGVLRYSLAVQEYAQTSDRRAVAEAKNAAARVEEQGQLYLRLADLPGEREMVARCRAIWQEMRRSGNAILARQPGEAMSEELRHFRQLRGQLGAILVREIRADADRRYTARSEATISGIQSHVRIASWLLSLGGPLAILAGVVLIQRFIRAERSVRDNEELLRMALESARIGMWSVKLGSGVTDCTPLMKGMFGLTSESATPVGNQWLSAVHTDDRAQVESAWSKSLAHFTPFEAEYRVVWPDGSLHWLESRGRALLDRQDKLAGFVGVTMETSDRRKRETNTRFLAEASTELAALVDPEATLRHIAQQAVPSIADFCAVDLLQPDGSLKRVASIRAPRKTGTAAAEMGHRQLADHCAAPGDLAEAKKYRWRLTSDKPSDERAANNSDFLQRLRKLGMRSYIGVPLTVRQRAVGVLTLIVAESGRGYDADDLAMVEDLTRRISIALENTQLYEEICDADRRKDEFLATLAHELRNPLAPIQNCVDVMRIIGPQNETITELRGVIERQVTYMTRLVDDLMDLSRIRQGKIHFSHDQVSIADVVQHAVETSQPLIEAHGHQLTISQPREELFVAGDKVRLSQILGNLLTNAAKYTPEHGRIWLNVESDAEDVVIRVRDNGMGIPPNMIGNVFEMFAQIHSHRRRARGGLGIGLALVKRLVEIHGGTIDVNSAGEGKGAEFIVRLPVVRTSRLVQTTAALEDTSSGIALRVLVVDDNVDAAESHAMLLKALGHTVHTAYGGVAAVFEARTFKPEVVLLDLDMPEVDGFETARQLRELPDGGQATLVAVTGWGQADQQRRTQAAGFDFHLLKPVEMGTLRDTLAEATRETLTSGRP